MLIELPRAGTISALGFLVPVHKIASHRRLQQAPKCVARDDLAREHCDHSSKSTIDVSVDPGPRPGARSLPGTFRYINDPMVDRQCVVIHLMGEIYPFAAP